MNWMRVRQSEKKIPTGGCSGPTHPAIWIPCARASLSPTRAEPTGSPELSSKLIPLQRSGILPRTLQGQDNVNKSTLTSVLSTRPYKPQVPHAPPDLPSLTLPQVRRSLESPPHRNVAGCQSLSTLHSCRLNPQVSTNPALLTVKLFSQ